MRVRRTPIFSMFIAALAIASLTSGAAPSAGSKVNRKNPPSSSGSPTPTPTSTPTTPPPPAASGAPLVPANGALFGAYVDPDGRWTDNNTAKNEVTNFEAEIGRKIAINQHYYSWTNTFPSGLEQWDVANGRIPLVSWDGITLNNITNGSQDSIIHARAAGMKALNAPVFLRWGWEMNGNWYPWSGTANNSSGQTDGPAKYIAAWRKIHDTFKADGADNVVWVWCPNNESVPSSAWNSWRNYYPGDAYVDWVCIDGYNWGTSRSWSSWRDFKPLMAGIYNDYADKKPIMIGETSSTEVGGGKADWITKMKDDIKLTMPAIKALVWFHVLKEEDWRTDSSGSAMVAYRTMGLESYFNP